MVSGLLMLKDSSTKRLCSGDPRDDPELLSDLSASLRFGVRVAIVFNFLLNFVPKHWQIVVRVSYRLQRYVRQLKSKD